MANKGKEPYGPSGAQGNPPRLPQTPPQNLPSGDYSFVLEIVMHMQETMGRLSEAVDGLKEKQTEQGKKLDRLSHQIYAAIVILLLLGGILTFFAGSINSIIVSRLAPPMQQQPTK